MEIFSLKSRESKCSLLNIIVICLVSIHFSAMAVQERFLQKKDGKQYASLVTGQIYYPYVDASLPNYGWSSAIVLAVFQHLNIDTQLGHFPWLRAEHYAKQAAYDGSFPYIFTEQRKIDFYYSDAINFVEVEILVRKDLDIPTFSSLINYRFCLPYGYEITNGFKQVISSHNLTRAPKSSDCLNKVIAGWSDVVLVNKYSKASMLEDNMPLKVLELAAPKESLHFIVAKSHPQAEKIIHSFNRALKVLKRTKQLDQINKRYMQLLDEDLKGRLIQ